MLLSVFFVGSACRLVTGGISPTVEPAALKVPTIQVELPKQVEGAAPTEALAEPTPTEISEASTGSEDSNPLQGMSVPSTDDLCSLLPKEVLEPLFGQKLSGSPEAFEDDYLGKGCSYDFGEENGAAYFAYISIAPISSFMDSKNNGSGVTDQPYLSGEAFSVDAADAQQLWVKLDENRAVVIAIGDRPNPDLALQLAFILVPLIQSLP